MTTARLRWSAVPAVVAALGIALALLTGCESDNTVAPLPETPLDSLVISPTTDTLQVGQTGQFTALACDTLGAPVVTTLHWTSTNTGVFTVNSSGKVSAKSEGVAWLVVSSGGQADSASVYVYPDTGWVLQPGSGSSLNG